MALSTSSSSSIGPGISSAGCASWNAMAGSFFSIVCVAAVVAARTGPRSSPGIDTGSRSSSAAEARLSTEKGVLSSSVGFSARWRASRFRRGRAREASVKERERRGGGAREIKRRASAARVPASEAGRNGRSGSGYRLSRSQTAGFAL